MADARARAAAPCALLVALLLLAAPAGRADAVSSVSPAARGLHDSRLYIASSVRETVDARTRRVLAGRLASRGEPIYVALVAFAPGDAFDGDGPRFLTALAGRRQRPGVYVTFDARGILWTRGYRVARADGELADQAARTVNLESRFECPPGPRLTSFLGALDDPDLDARERRANAAFRKRVGSGGVPARSRPPVASRDDGGLSGVMFAVIGAGAVLLLGTIGLLLRRRRGARPVDDRPVLPERVFSLAREASRDELAERAEAMLIALSALIDASPPSVDTQRALDAYEAADRVLRCGARDVLDLVGALVCIDLGRGALGSGREPPPCTYDPRHGPAHGPAVCVEATKLRLCRSCRADLQAGRQADVLRDGKGRPYFDGDTPWASTGFGAWSDPVDAVLERKP